MEDRLLYCGVALLSACSWALGAILWRKLGEQLSSYSMNLSKVLIGSICLGFILLFVGFEAISVRSVVFLGLSGVLGIAVGDTFFFLALMQLGPRRASLMGSLNPVAIAVAAAVFLGERPASGVWAGIVVTTLGVGWVIWERASAGLSTENNSLGIRYGLLSVLCTAAAVLLAKIGVASVPTVQAAWIRLLSGAVGLVFWGLWRSELGTWVAPFRSVPLLAKVLGVVLVVVVGGFWLSIVALKHIDAAIAGTLNSTSPLFILPMSCLLMKEKLSLRTITGTAIAVGGVALILRG
ncbi:MAG: DMT family transporter [Candidatus Riflebacteria bacterium]|nr:DMT family transporter [Candidatus Riflebacteria bacterium]